MSVFPSHLRIGHTERFSDGGVFDDVQFHFGEVQSIIYANDENSRSKQFTEYSVFVQYRDPITKAGVGRMYDNCLLSNMFGGVSDFLSYTLRGQNSTASAKDDRLGLGSKVLLLCINGETQYPVIIGGIGDPTDKSQTDTKDKDLGHHLKFIFNGLGVSINKDGELTVVFNGPTDIKGKLVDGIDKKTVGASVTFSKEGKIIVNRNQAIEIGAATDHFILGDTYRDAEHSMNQDLQTGLQNVAQKLAVAGAQLAAAGGAVAGPFMAAAAGPNLVSASAQIISAVGELNKMASSIAKFEAQAKKYLSKDNKTD